ncbi:MAG: HEAT repeat domain-containing protein [Deltaproteobacteria bacterium]|nr:HEAT repeat domain-containing protein [Deltaproteobacteria bacterium]
MHLTCLAIVGYALAAAPASPATKTDEVRAKVAAYLATHDVAQAPDLHALSPAPGKALMAIATDGHADGIVRARAVAALRLLPSPEVRAFLGRLVQDKAKARDADDRLLLRRAAIALGWLSGPRACEQLASLFDNDDPEVRVDAAIGLGLTRAAGAPRWLRRRLAVEKVARVRDQIERQLRALGQDPAGPQKPPAPRQRQPMRSGF